MVIKLKRASSRVVIVYFFFFFSFSCGVSISQLKLPCDSRKIHSFLAIRSCGSQEIRYSAISFIAFQNGGSKEGKVKKGEAGKDGGWYEQCQGKRREFLQVQSRALRSLCERNNFEELRSGS